MNEHFLLDTNTISAALDFHAGVIDHIMHAQRLYVPAVVLGELYHGAYKSARRDSNLAICAAIARFNTILTCEEKTADVYEQIIADLEARAAHPRE